MKKAEKLHITKAAALYRASLVAPVDAPPLLDSIRTNPQYITTTIQAMTLPEVQLLHEAFEDISTVRESTVLQAMLPNITPNHNVIVNRINLVTAQLEQLNIQKEALETVVGTALTEEFYGDTQFNFTPLFDLTHNHKKHLEDELIADQRRQLQALNAARAANTDMDI